MLHRLPIVVHTLIIHTSQHEQQQRSAFVATLHHVLAEHIHYHVVSNRQAVESARLPRPSPHLHLHPTPLSPSSHWCTWSTTCLTVSVRHRCRVTTGSNYNRDHHRHSSMTAIIYTHASHSPLQISRSDIIVHSLAPLARSVDYTLRVEPQAEPPIQTGTAVHDSEHQEIVREVNTVVICFHPSYPTTIRRCHPWPTTTLTQMTVRPRMTAALQLTTTLAEHQNHSHYESPVLAKATH